MSVMRAHPSPSTPSSNPGGRLVSADGRLLPFRGGRLAVDAMGGLARVTLRQRFFNPYAEPLKVSWSVPLPADAAVSGFCFELEGARIVGVVEGRQAARERFEEALIEGRTAALLEQERSSLFTQEVGNIPPGAELVCELTLDQLLLWQAPLAGWEWRFPTVVAPRYLGENGRVADASAVTVPVADGDLPARMALQIQVRDLRSGPLASPTHALHLPVAEGGEAGLAEEGGAALDRDIVVRWPVGGPQAGLSLDLARASADKGISAQSCGLLSLVPPRAVQHSVARDLVVLLDTSGSMGGRPIAQAKAVTRALVESLSDGDQLQIIEFSTRPRAFKDRPLAATPANKAAAIRWVEGLSAGGGTEMRSGILAALKTLRGEAQRQVILVTDGLIGFEQEIIGAIALDLPRGCRVHTVGIGSGVNRSLLTPAARAGGGIEVLIGLDEGPEEAALALVAATAAPQVVDVQVEGSALAMAEAPRCPDLMGGRPARVALRLRPEGGELIVRGQAPGGAWLQRLTVPACAPGQGSPAVVALVGREMAEELELKAAQGQSVDAELEALGVAWQISTRCTSWVAVHPRKTVDPSAPTRSEQLPQSLPYGMSAEGLGLRAPAAMMPAPIMPASLAMPMMELQASLPHERVRRARSAPAPLGGAGGMAPTPPAPPAAPGAKKRSKPLLSRVMDAFWPGEKASMDDEIAEAPAMAREEAAAGPIHEIALVARILLAKDDRVSLEVTVGAAGLAWSHPQAPIRVRLADGTELVVALDAGRSTRSGWLAAGAVLRITLVASGLAALQLEEVHLPLGPMGGPLLRLQLSR